jgi:cbb3-type cytochrome oxidase cytochrome c subunit
MSKQLKWERFSSVILYAGLLCFLFAFVMLGIVPAQMTKASKRDDELAKSVPDNFKEAYATVETYRQGLIRGRDIYVAEACWHCHSQYVRPVSNEVLRYGPVSTPGEYENLLQLPQLFGTRRVGPDLIREGGKRTNDWHFSHFYNPRSVEPQSVMPSYTWYFENVDGKVLPKPDAVALVAYVQWLGSWINQPPTSAMNDIIMPPAE